MSQGSILTDMFANSSASINALLAQMQNALGNGSSEGNNFSSLLSDSSTAADPNASAALSAQTDAVTATPVTATVDAPVTVSTAPSSAAAELKKMQDLSAILHKAMNMLRQQDHKESSRQTKTSATAADKPQIATQQTAVSKIAAQSKTTDTKNTSSDSTTSTSTTQTSTDTSTATASASDTATDSTADDNANSSNTTDAQTIEKLIAELMLLTQTVIKNLQQAQSATGTAQNTAIPSPDTKIIGDLQDLLASLTGGSTGDSSSADLAAQISSSPDAFQKLLAVLQKAAKQPISDDTDTAQAEINTAVTAAPSDLTATDTVSLTAAINNSDLTTQPANVNARIKDDFPAAQKQGMDSPSAQMAATTQVAPTGLAATTAAAKITAATASATATQNAAVALNSNVSQSPAGSSDATAAQPLTTLMASRSFGNTDTESESSMHGGSGAPANGFDTSMMLSSEGGSVTGATNFADHLASMRMTSTAVLQQPSPVDQAILQISRGLKNGNDQMSLQLHPADLGKITVKLDFTNDGKVQGTVTADNPKTLELLQKDSRSLERALQDAGLRADPGSLSFNLGNPSGQNNGQAAAGKTNASGTLNPDGTISADEDRKPDDNMAGAETYYITPTGINIRV